MAGTIYVVIAQWDVYMGLVKHYCSILEGRGFRCIFLQPSDQRAVDLMLRYGVDNGLVRLPLILFIIDDKVRVLDIGQLRLLSKNEENVK